MSAPAPWPVDAARAWLEKVASEHAEGGLPDEADELRTGLRAGAADAEESFRELVAEALWWDEEMLDEAVAEVRRGPRACRVCGCTDDDCRGCIERSGRPCSWAEPDLCSACVEVDHG